MRKRIVYMFCLLMVSLLGVVGCAKDPYAQVSISIENMDSSKVQQVLISRSEIDSDGNNVYSLPDITIEVKVDNYGELDPYISVSGWEGYLAEPTISYLGDGLTRVISKPLSHESTGKFELTFRTSEGNKFETLQFEVDLKIDSFKYNSQPKLNAVATDYELELDSIDGLIEYYPANTTQKDIIFSIAQPLYSVGENYQIYDRLEDVQFLLDENLLRYLSTEFNYKYADIINEGGKQILRVYPYFVDSTGNYALDEEGNYIPTIFPQILDETIVGGEPVSIDTITIKATSPYTMSSEFLDVEVVPSVGQTVLTMNAQEGNEPIVVNQDKKGEYNIVLIDRDYKSGIITGSDINYFTERDLSFSILGLPEGENDGDSLDVYRVISNNIDANDDLPIELSLIGEGSDYKVSSLTAGKYSHKFKLQHVKYPGIFDKEIVVNFKVVSIPFNITVNGVTLTAEETSDNVVTLYDVYAKGSYGTKFKVDTGSGYGYFIYLDNDESQNYLYENLVLRREGDGKVVEIAQEQYLNSEDKTYATFSSSSNFYMSHVFENFGADAGSPDKIFNIGITFNVCDDSYSDKIRDRFSNLLLTFPIRFTAEKGITKIDFLQNHYYINLNNTDYQFSLDGGGFVLSPETGFKLWEMPVGRNVSNAIKSITYNEELIKVYDVYDATSDVTSLYVKFVEGANAGRTTINIETLNGIKNSVIVDTYIPTAYANSTIENPMPLCVEVDEYSSGYLYTMSGKDSIDHNEKWDIVNSYNINYSYNSVDTLFVITNAEQAIEFYDFRLVNNMTYLPVNITNRVTVTFNYGNYLTYSDGVLKSHNLVTLDIDSPIIMNVRYVGGYETSGEEGSGYATYTINHKIKVYIYNPLEGVEVTSAKTVDLYVADSLGYFNQDLSYHTIVSTYIPNEVNLGAEWNKRFSSLTGCDFVAVELWYDYVSQLNSDIITSSGSELKIQSLEGNAPYVVKYSDLFQPVLDGGELNNYEITFRCVMSDELVDWFNANGYTSDKAKSTILQEHVFAENIIFVVNVYIQQFERLQNINSVKFTARFAKRISSLKLDVDDDGLVFEVRQDRNGEWQLSQDFIEVEYTIDDANVLDNTIFLQNYETSFYSAVVVPNATGNGGKLVVTPKFKAGVGYLSITPQDNIRTYNHENGECGYYETGLVLSFRIKIADGSEEFPFEIRNAERYAQMYNDTNDKLYYNYIITRDINLNGYNTYNLNVVVFDGCDGYKLTGKHVYFKNGEEITVFSSIYNLTIRINNINAPMDIGLFGFVDECATLDNITVNNANVEIHTVTDENIVINVGILAGRSNSEIVACSVSGNISVLCNSNSASVAVGGMIGRSNGATISSLPGRYEKGIVSTGNNSYVDISLESDSQSDNIIAGGLIGVVTTEYGRKTEVQDIIVSSNITATTNATIGGVVGAVLDANLELNNVDIVSSIIANIDSVAVLGKYGLIAGGIVGRINDSGSADIERCIISYINIGNEIYNTWQERSSIYIVAPNESVAVGGMVGLSQGSASIVGSYIRSYYDRELSDLYYGDIFVYAGEDSVIGGLVGVAQDDLNIIKSYFDGNISYFATITNSAMMVGCASAVDTSIDNSYAIGLLSTISLQDANTDGKPDVDSNGQLILLLEQVSSETQNLLIGNLALATSPLKNTYAVVNGGIFQYSTNSSGVGFASVTDMLNGQSIDSFLNGKIGTISYGDSADWASYNWFWYNNVNTMVEGGIVYSYPLIIYQGKVLYDIVPTGIDVVINTKEGLYDITLNADVPQVIMYLNKTTSGKTDGTYYTASIDSDSSAFSIKLQGTEIITQYVRVGLNDKIELLEDSDESIIRIVGNRIYPVNKGLATLTVRSYVSQAIKCSITILVVDGINDYSITNNNQKLEETNLLPRSFSANTVYIDEISDFEVSSSNIIKGTQYISNSNFGFVMEILDVSGDGLDNGVFKINGIEFKYNSNDLNSNIYVFNSRTFKVAGVSLGNVRLMITPFINLTDVTYIDTYTSCADSNITKVLNNVYLLDGGNGDSLTALSKVFDIEVRSRARSITNAISSATIDSRNSVDFSLVLETANVKIDGDNNLLTIFEDINLKINNKFVSVFGLQRNFDFVIEGNKYVINLNGSISFEYTLVNLIFEEISVELTNIDPMSRQNTYKIVFGGYVEFDKEYYRANAKMYDLNNVSFNIEFIPTSNVELSTEMEIRVLPNDIREIYTNFYSKGVDKQAGDEYETEYPQYNESTFIVPGRDGLLKINLDEEFNNSSYVTITFPKEMINYLTIQQLSAVVEGDSINLENGNITIGDVVGFQNVVSQGMIETQSSYGIKLSKLSLNYKDNNYFNNTYYVKILASKDINVSQLTFTITSYKTDAQYDTTEQLSKNVNLTVMDLPHISMTVDGDDYAVMGYGVMKPLEVVHRGLANNVSYSISCNNNAINAYEYMLIVDDQGEMVGDLSVDYLNSGRQYYICLDVSCYEYPGLKFTLEFIAQEIILGSLEECRANLVIDAVEFEIDKILVFGIEDTLTLLHGATARVAVEIIPKEIVVGKADAISAYKELLQMEFGRLELVQYSFAGATVCKYEDGQEDVLVDNVHNLQYPVTKNGVTYYEDLTNGEYEGITLTETFRKTVDQKYTFRQYIIQGTSISNNTNIRFDAEYYYNNLGQICIGNNSNYVYTYTQDILIIVEDNSTYDHPTPIETQEDLVKASAVEGGNYILLNNITLKHWAPVEAKFDTLDGNGYILTIESFNLSAFRGANSADVGLFTVIAEGTLIKNLTIDIELMLKTENEMLNDISRMRASTATTYSYDSNVDLGYVSELNFGIIAGTNNGSITNAKVISTRPNNKESQDIQLNKYFHVQTTLGYIDDSLAISNIGGMVGVNGATGAITNSFIGVSIADKNVNGFVIEGINDASVVHYNNTTDVLQPITIYPFVLAGGNYIGGVACTNDGIISNTYAKGVGVYNSFPSVNDSATAGFVTFNNNIITSCFVEGDALDDENYYRAINNNYIVESTGYIGGLVYENSSIIENAYSNVYVQTLSSFLGGFVFINKDNGIISNAYSTAINHNSLATGQFTGVKQGVVQNSGIYNNCYYLVAEDNGEFENIYEDAYAINSENFGNIASWNGFSFATGSNADGIWTLVDGISPKIGTTLTDTTSFRKLTDIDNSDSLVGTVYSYTYDTYILGSKENPLLIDKSKNLSTYIIDNSINVNGERIFGYGSSKASSAMTHVRLVNNLDFETLNTSQEHKDTYLYKVVFAGVFDGNGMTLNNLNITTDTTGLKDFGLFAQVGSEKVSHKAVIKNLNINLRTFMSTGNNNAGIIAGTMVNSSIVNVNIDGNNQTISAFNNAGGLAGVIYATGQHTINLIDIEISNIRVESTYSSLGGTINSRSEDKSTYFFNSFTVETEGKQSTEGHSFESLYKNGATDLNYLKNSEYLNKISYAGGVAGVLLANNYGVEINSSNGISDYRTKAEDGTVSGIIVREDVIISTADNAGGLFGYIGENTLVKNSYLEANESQLIKAFNFIGGIVGEHHGVLERCYIEYDQETQSEYDATILDNMPNSGDLYLFDMSEGEPYYSVSIGGIAGGMENGVIIDSYTKVNVVKKLAYIAGGIVGYATGYNYLGNVFNTGAVYGMYVTGGVVGLQVNHYNDSALSDQLSMHQVISLTNWNVVTGDLDIRGEISKKLYDNIKGSYLYIDESTSSSTYYNFYLKMPEVGNQPIVADENSVKTYRNSHNNYYIGSVVGKALAQERVGGLITINNGAGGADKLSVFANWELLASMYDVDVVVSSTLGLVDTTGSIEEGNRVDDFFKSTFKVERGDDVSFESTSYRVAYPTTLNEYTVDTVFDNTESGKDVYYDKFSYDQIFTTQEYRQQILGSAYSKNLANNGSVDDSDVIDLTKGTKNIFLSGYQDIRAESNPLNAFVASTGDKVWTMSGLLPVYSNGVVESSETVSNSTEMMLALRNTSSGKLFKVDADTIDIEIDSTDKVVEYFGGIKSIFVGIERLSGLNPTINITVDSTSYISSIFNLWNGATFENLNFVFNLNKNYSSIDADDVSVGLVTNTLNGVYINNCSFTINLNSNIDFTCGKNSFYGENVGLIFGHVYNSVIKDSHFVINTNQKAITIHNENITNVGLFAGYINSSNITDSSLNIYDGNAASEVNITLKKSSNEVSVGGVSGRVSNSKLSYFDLTQLSDGTDRQININDHITAEDSIVNVGSLFGYINNTNYIGGNSTTKTMIVAYNTSTNTNAKSEELNVALLAGKSYNSTINSFVIKSDEDAINYRINVTSSKDVQNLSVGTIIGFDRGSSKIGNTGVVGSYSNITVGVKSLNASVGGLIGRSNGSNQLVNNGFYDGDIVVVNEHNRVQQIIVKDGEEKVTYVDVYSMVGGILGYASNKVVLKNVLSAGDYSLNVNYTYDDYQTAGIGGIVGGADNSVEINGFASLVDNMTFTESSANPDSYLIDKHHYTYVSGVLGYNGGMFKGTNGYSYVQFNEYDYTKTSAITQGSINSSSNDVFYCQEFGGNNYEGDIKFDHFSMGDLYNTISQYSPIYNLIKNNIMAVDTIGNIQLPMPTALIDVVSRSSQLEGDDKFNLAELDSSTTNVTGYNVINSRSASFTITKIGSGAIVAGRSYEDGKTIISLEHSTSTTKTFVKTNNGILSNIYFNVGSDDKVNNLSLVEDNNGRITLSYIYGVSSNNYTFAQTNNGIICLSGSAIKYKVSGGNSALYGLVYTNYGEILDCYSGSFGYIEAENYTTKIYGFAKDNKGYIKNSTYYIPENMLVDNKAMGYSEKNEGVITKCYATMLPESLLKRNKVWTEENGHAQVVGLKDAGTSTVIAIYYGNIKMMDMNDINVRIKETVANSAKSYALTYKYLFYPQPSAIPYYDVVRINTGDGFVDYINSINNADNSIPTNTVILLTNYVDGNGNATNTLKINPAQLKPFTVGSSSALIGIGTNDSKIILDFQSSTTSGDKNRSISHEFITSNYGTITGITLQNIELNSVETGNIAFAPISNNHGIIADINIVNAKVITSQRMYVAGLVAVNGEGGMVTRVQINSMYLSSTTFVNLLCTKNSGVIRHSQSLGYIFPGNIYSGGVNDAV